MAQAEVLWSQLFARPTDEGIREICRSYIQLAADDVVRVYRDLQAVIVGGTAAPVAVVVAKSQSENKGISWSRRQAGALPGVNGIADQLRKGTVPARSLRAG